MAAPAPEKDKKRKPAEAGKAPAADAAKPEIAKDKAALGAMLRPEGGDKAAKMEVGGKGEKAEKEADKVADEVMKDAPAGGGKEGPEGKEQKEGEEPARTYNQARGPPALTLAIDNTVRRVADPASQPNLDSLSAVPALPGNMSEVGVSTPEENKFDEMTDGDFNTLSEGEGLRPKFQPGQGGPGRFALSPGTAARIRDARGGSVLPGALRSRIEGRLHVDLSAIRVHTGDDATELCTRIGARAFAYGRNIWLRSASEATDTRLMAHEVVHTVQQGAARRVPRPDPETVRRPRARAAQPRAPPPAPVETTQNTVRRFSEEGDDGWLARKAEGLADRLDSYGVLKVLIGRRLFTGQSVNPSAIDYVGAFMKFIGADETFEQMKQSGSLQKGFDAIKEGLTTYDITWDRVKGLFSRAIDDFEWTAPISSFTRVFREFFSDVLAYGLHVLKIIAKLVAEAFVIGFGPMGKAVWEKIQAIGETIGLIISDPLQFALNLIKAVGNGIKGFGERIWTHIKAGLLAWILGPFQQMGITLPEKLDLKGIVSVILQVLGLTYPQLRPRIVKALNPNGEVKVSVVERLIEVVNILRTEGLVGIWRKLMEYVENLQMTIINGIRDWVVRAVVQAGIRKLVAWSNPAGALIDILLTIYNLIVFFVERFQQILDFASSIFDSIGKIARGQLGDAALAVETSMAKTIPIIISFIVRFLGLPDIGGTIRGIITKIRAKVHAAFDKALDWIIKKVKKLIAGLVKKFKGKKGVPKNPVVLQGDTHSMELQQKGARRELMILSEPAPMTADYLQGRCDVMQDKCAEPITTTLLPQLRQCVEKLRALEAEERRLSKLPEPNRDTPKVAAERDKLLAEIKTLLEAGTSDQVLTQEETDSGQVDADELGEEHNAETKPPREDQEDQVKPDLNEPTFRFVVLNNITQGEGFAGPWKEAKAQREVVKKKLETDGSTAKYLIELDHNPEWAILRRVAFLYSDPQPAREGQDPGPAQPAFPGLKAQFSGDLTDPGSASRDLGAGLMAMATRREVNTSEINKAGELYRTFDSLAEWNPTANRYEYKKDEASGKTTAADAPDWTAKVAEKAGEHQAALLANYQKYLEVRDSDQSIVDAVTTNGPKMVSTTQGFMSGSIAKGEMFPGPHGADLSGTGMRDDPIGAELTDGPSYSKAVALKKQKAPEFGRALQTHHMIEQAVLKAIKAEVNAIPAGTAIADDASGVAGFNRSAKAPSKTLSDALKDKKDAEGKPLDAAAEWAELGNPGNLGPSPSVFPAKSIEQEGYAVNVLMQVNQLAGTNSPSAATTSAQAARSAPLNTMVEAFNGKIAEAYGAVPAEAAKPEDLASARTKASTALSSHIQGKLGTDLKTVLSDLIGDAAGNAYDKFRGIQDTSMAGIKPADPANPLFDPRPGEPSPNRREVFQALQQRNAALTREHLIAENRKIWASG
ncbi:MAG: DUF4157 domain-containing protein [Rhodobacter sp.]|nr:DUF4157 domain-containing protein [Rhodobacter sp.]